MAFRWSENQKRAIETDHCNLLVSAAAGSGKTTVLVGRVMEHICRENDPVGLDEMLIVTFTRASASDMKEKLHEKLLKKISENPDNGFLRKQLYILPIADICTIDAYCLRVLQNYFYKIGMDPDFRIAEEGEMAILKEDVFSSVLEEKYEEKNELFIALADYLNTDKKDDKLLQTLVYSIYGKAQSMPNPEKWMQSLTDAYSVNAVEELREKPWYREYVQFKKDEISGRLKNFEEIFGLLNEIGDEKAAMWRDTISEEEHEFRKGLSCQTLDDLIEWSTELKQYLKNHKLNNGKSIRCPDAENLKWKKIIGICRDEYKELADDFSQFTPDAETVCQLTTMKPIAAEAVTFTRTFSDRFKEAKSKKRIFDFSDIEHFALQILLDEEGRKTDVAQELSAHFKEILVDEYQDINEAQETFIEAISGAGENKKNIFRVGDVKQSIYLFRMARPDLFQSKYDSYIPCTEERGDERKIELNENYRSRKVVTDAVNAVFKEIMIPELGGIRYNEEVQLNPKGSFECTSETLKYNQPAELDLIQISSGERTNQEEAQENSRNFEDDEKDFLTAEIEAAYIAGEIRKIVEEDPIYIEDTRLVRREGGIIREEKYLRKAEYKDIVILKRSIKGEADAYKQVMDDEGIPFYVERKTGFYDTYEIQIILNLLKAINNPLEDIPFVATLVNPIFRFTSDELVAIQGFRKKVDESEKNKATEAFYLAALRYAEEMKDELATKIRATDEQLKRYRRYGEGLSLSLMLRSLYKETGLSEYMAALPSGHQRLANLEEFVRHAKDFDRTSYHGIYNFLRYIQSKREAETDDGESPSLESDENIVRLLTIHSSKGLEYPIVFVAGLGKEFFNPDFRETILCNPAAGLAFPYRKPAKNRRISDNGTYKDAVLEKMKRLYSGEDLRILYVAMTRAKEKLYLVGTWNPSKEIPDYDTLLSLKPRLISASSLLNEKNYLFWILQGYRPGMPLEIRNFNAETVKKSKKKDVRLPDFEKTVDDKKAKEFSGILYYNYHQNDLRLIEESTSVSRLKAEGAMDIDTKDSYSTFISGKNEENWTEREVEEAKDQGIGISAARRGTLYHLVFEKMNPGEKAEDAIARLTSQNLISEEEKGKINAQQIDAFYESELGKRAIKAAESNKLFREKQFIMGVPIAEIYPDKKDKVPEGETIMVQGVIDLYFEEEDGVVLVDYKTDRVKCAEELENRYKIQLKYYKDALEKMGKKVKEIYIYSVSLKEAYRLKE